MMEIDGDGDFKQTVHALQTDLVLDELVKYLRQSDVLRCRQVCKKWNRHLIPRMRTEMQVKCLDQSGFGRSSTRLAKFLSVMESSQEIPFGNFLLLNLNLNDPLVEKFFVLCGLYIHTLRIQFMPNDIDISSFRELLLMRAPSMVNFCLEGQGLPESVTNHPGLFPSWSGYYLHFEGTPSLPYLESIQFKTEEEQKCHPEFLYDLFKAAVHLKNFTFLKYSDPSYSVKILASLNRSLNYNQLTSIRLESLTESAFEILIRMSHDGMRLKEFSFVSLAEDVTSTSLEQLIVCHKDTLESLDLNEVMGMNNLQIRLPQMKRLKRLTRSAICPAQILFGPICYASYMLSLEELSVFAFADELDWNEYFSDIYNWLPCTSLRKLELPIKLRDPNKLRRLSRMFPSVTKVIADSPADEVIPLLWELWPELSELHLSLTDGNSNIDSLFTGIPSQECANINAIKSYGEVDIERIRTGPSIAHLRGLKKLCLEISPKDIFSSFCLQNTSCLPTDVTVHFGLAYLNNLEDLSITSSQISREGGVFLHSKLQKFANIRILDSENRTIVSTSRVSC